MSLKIPVYCSLIPTELIISLGYEPYYLTADELVSDRPREYYCAFHENLCSYSKSLYDYFLKNHEDFALIIVPTSCDAMKKLYNALREKISTEKLYLIDVPKVKTISSGCFFTGQTMKLANHLKKYSNFKCTVFPEQDEKKSQKSQLTIGIFGANVPMNTVKKGLEKFGFETNYLNHCLTKSHPDPKLFKLLADKGIKKYAHAFMDKNSCPRTNDDKHKDELLKKIKNENIKGLIVNSLKFCDFHPFDFKYLKNALGVNFPILLLEHELASTFEGQTMTRIEAFLENIKRRCAPGKNKVALTRSGKYFVGIDSGSHATKLVCVDKDKNIIAREVISTGTSVKKSAESVLKTLETKYGIKSCDIARIVATGYGRSKLDSVDEAVTEISCHALGANFLINKPMTIIDIGGQDSKAIKIDEKGNVVRFAMNDKCAAGTGRFLEVMSSKLEMSLEEFAELSRSAKKSASISSMCSVFAESEVISLIASGISKDEIAKGLHRAIAERTIALARRVEGEPPYYMTGGVAKNKGLVKELENCLEMKIAILDEPQFSGALGAAIIASRTINDV